MTINYEMAACKTNKLTDWAEISTLFGALC
jgi:hypothetical protein